MRPMHEKQRLGIRPRRVVPTAAIAVAAVLLAAVGLDVRAVDDTFLLRQNSAHPYVFFILDTSASMALGTKWTPQGQGYKRSTVWVNANADDPRSRLYQAKEALYDVVDETNDVQFGFATLNQDRLRAVSKHWLYYATATTTLSGTWPFATLPVLQTTPLVESLDPVTQTVSLNLVGDLMVFGPPINATGVAGSCASPLDLGDADQRSMVNRFAKLDPSVSPATTVIWVKSGSGAGTQKYKLTFTSTGNAADAIGLTPINVLVTADRDDACDGTYESTASQSWSLTRYKPFLMFEGRPPADTQNPATLITNDEAVPKKGTGWNWWDFREDDNYGGSKPFSGAGWEGNYDTSSPSVPNAYKIDPYCRDVAGVATCDNIREITVADSNASLAVYPETDIGDVLPFSWNSNNKTAILQRLNPFHGSATRYFGQADAFADTAVGGILPLAAGVSQPPILAGGSTPLGAAMLDFRCWYTGDEANKCKSGQNPTALYYTEGFLRVSYRFDGDYVCRNPFLIVITDGEENSGQSNDATATVADFQKDQVDLSDLTNPVSGVGPSKELTYVRTWILNMGENSLGHLAKGGEEIFVRNADDLRKTLRDILGIIQQQQRTFASAAVPNVQAEVSDKIYTTSFGPQRKNAVWSGEVHSFVKPLPLNSDGTPNITHKNHLWDAGQKLKNQAIDRGAWDSNLGLVTDPRAYPSTLAPPIPDYASLQVGYSSMTAERRVFYTMGTDYPYPSDGATVPRVRLLLAPPVGNDEPTGITDDQVKADFWYGLGLIDKTEETAIAGGAVTPDKTTKSEEILIETYTEKPYFDETPTQIPTKNYILGDIFHANPQIVGGPRNQRYLANANDFPGYDEFAKVFERRRKMLFVGANDGMLHAFNAGYFDGGQVSLQNGAVTIEGSFDQTDSSGNVVPRTGEGNEAFAYVPRPLLKTLTELEKNRIDHVWSVDGQLTVFDAFLDPRHDGTPTPAERSWRTVLVGSVRRGGSIYYALDVTQPDKMTKVTDSDGNTVGYYPTNANPMPDCIDATGAAASYATCDGQVEYPAVLWEFTGDADGNGVCDNDEPIDDPTDVDTACDLGETWSTPNVGVIRVEEEVSSGTWEVNLKPVVIFGGGRDPDGRINKIGSTADKGGGNYLYILDAETGKQIYKRRVDGSVPAEVAAVDVNQDGILDRVYFGTTAGKIYRLDLDPSSTLVDSDGDGTPDKAVYARLPLSPRRISNSDILVVKDHAWEPYEIYDTVTTIVNADASTTDVRRQIFFRPTVIFVPELGRYAIAFGTGQRDNLWAGGPADGNRVVIFVDDTDVLVPDESLPRPAPIDETVLQLVDLTVGTVGFVTDNLLASDTLNDGERGWYGKIGGVQAETVVTPVTSISGVSTFATYSPVVSRDLGNGNATPTCNRGGDSFAYLMFTASGGGIFEDSSGLKVPKEGIPGVLVTEPFVEQTQTKNKTCEDDPTAPECVDRCAGKEDIADALKEQIFPKKCKFASYGFNLETMKSDTGIECIAPLPVCIVEKNWKEF